MVCLISFWYFPLKLKNWEPAYQFRGHVVWTISSDGSLCYNMNKMTFFSWGRKSKKAKICNTCPRQYISKKTASSLTLMSPVINGFIYPNKSMLFIQGSGWLSEISLSPSLPCWIWANEATVPFARQTVGPKVFHVLPTTTKNTFILMTLACYLTQHNEMLCGGRRGSAPFPGSGICESQGNIVPGSCGRIEASLGDAFAGIREAAKLSPGAQDNLCLCKSIHQVLGGWEEREPSAKFHRTPQ